MTEICIQVEETFEQAKAILAKSGFEFGDAFTNFDTYYTTLTSAEDEEYQTLLKNSIVVRHIVGDNCDVKNVVYKNKTLDAHGNVIDEVKTKVKVDDIEKAKQIFKNLGLNCWCDYAVNNFEMKKGELSVDLQYVENLGTFVEIEEYPSIKSLPDTKKFAILKNIVKDLGFKMIGNDYSCKKPYMFLLKNHTNRTEI